MFGGDCADGARDCSDGVGDAAAGLPAAGDAADSLREVFCRPWGCDFFFVTTLVAPLALRSAATARSRPFDVWLCEEPEFACPEPHFVELQVDLAFVMVVP